jgi:hypothetical protein
VDYASKEFGGWTNAGERAARQLEQLPRSGPGFRSWPHVWEEAAAQHAADLVERIVLVTTPVQVVLLDPAADLVDGLSAVTWNASKTWAALGRCARSALS